MSEPQAWLQLVEDQVPPQDLEAEQAVLGALLLGIRLVAYEVSGLLQASDFYRGAHQAIYAAVMELLRAGEPVDMTTVGAKLRATGQLDAAGGLDYLDRLVRSTPYSLNAVGYAKVVAEAAAKRAVLWAGLRVAQLAYDSRLKAAQVQSEAYAELSAAIAAHVSGPETRYEGDEALELYGERKRWAGQPISTGFETLDTVLYGGWQRQQLHVLTAATSMGKSMLALHFVLAAIQQGAKVGLASLEMPLEECYDRLLSIATGVPYSHVRPGLEWLAEQTAFDGRSLAATLRAHLERFARRLVVDEASGYDVPTMSRRLRRLREEDGCDLLVLDHFGNVDGEGRDQFERMVSVERELERLAHPAVLGVPLLVVAQQNRDGASESSLERIYGCYRLVQHSPVVLSFERERQAAAGQRTIKGKLKVLKNRTGQAGMVIELEGDRYNFRWREVRPDDVADVSPNEFDEDPFAE